MDNIIRYILIILIILGLFQCSIIIEETIHVIHGKGAKSMCLDFNLKINDSIQSGYLLAHTVFEPTKEYKNVSEYYTWREHTEKIAWIGNYIFIIIVSMILGYNLNGELYGR